MQHPFPQRFVGIQELVKFYLTFTGELAQGIEYDYNKATLRQQSKKVLDELYDFLMLNNNIDRRHTDCGEAMITT